MAGLKINPDCVLEFNDWKMGRSKHAYLVLAVSADLKEIAVERRGNAGDDWNAMVSALPANEPRYIVTHFHWDQGPIDGKRSRMVFIHWSPSGTTLKMRLVYAASKQSVKQALTGIPVDIQAGCNAELSPERALEVCQRYNKA